MPTAKTNLKKILSEECLPALSARDAYFSVADVRRWLKRHRHNVIPATLGRYLHGALAEGQIHDAGRGWYSTLARPLVLDREAVTPLVALIEKNFPALGFTVWSTQQINPWMHHLLGKFVTFVHVEAEGVSAVWELLRDAGYDAHLNPGKKAAARTFAVRDKTVVVRTGSPAQAPVDGHYASPEKLLVDLAVEIEELPLMDQAEFTGLFSSAASAGRLDIPSILRYAARKRIADRISKCLSLVSSQNAVL